MAMPQKITELYAWIATETDGSEGLPAVVVNLGGSPIFTPLVGADQARITSLEEQARKVHGSKPGLKMRLVRFTVIEEIREL